MVFSMLGPCIDNTIGGASMLIARVILYAVAATSWSTPSLLIGWVCPTRARPGQASQAQPEGVLSILKGPQPSRMLPPKGNILYTVMCASHH